MMSYREPLDRCAIAISTSDSPDMPSLGLSDEHLKDAMAEIARHLLALGAHLVYGGDLRAYGFTELLFELVARHRSDAHDADQSPAVANYLAWPVHICMKVKELEQLSHDLSGSAKIVCLGPDGRRLTQRERLELAPRDPTESEWPGVPLGVRASLFPCVH
jgi:hypothetical protein